MGDVAKSVVDLDYINVLTALQEIPFGVGKKLLAEFLQGKTTNKTIIKHQMYKYSSFGTLGYSDEELIQLINHLIHKDMVMVSSIKGNSFWKVLQISAKGIAEISSPTLNQKNSKLVFDEKRTIITEKERQSFKSIPFLDRYNDEQKKAIICPTKSILCIAGAGSGKTTVLTKRIEFLITYRSVDPKEILAITFTKKAREEMITRIKNPSVVVETFNSFCEKQLRKHNHLLYDREVQVISYRDKILILRKALSTLGIPSKRAINLYFSIAQRKGKTDEKLMNIFLNDMYMLRDFFRARNLEMNSDLFAVENEHKNSFNMICAICNLIDGFMKDRGLRDFSDQLIETLNLFKSCPELTPKYSHILIDEFQDVNASQIQLIDLLDTKNIFCVGDPRQSIYGWRGSDIKYILNFEDKYPGCEIISLTKNYRSSKKIVDLSNSSCRELGFADLESASSSVGENSGNEEKEVFLVKKSSQKEEFEFVIEKIVSSDVSRGEIFVLARTNRLLTELSDLLKERKIKHVLRNEHSLKGEVLASKITLATVHSIKGMEATMVFVIGCSSNNFPCKGSDHPIMEMINDKDYDKEDEEKRVLYVALSRAKKELYISCVKTPSYFFSADMLKLVRTNISSSIKFKFAGAVNKVGSSAYGEVKTSNIQPVSRNFVKQDNTIFEKLKDWRFKVSKSSKLPAYRVLHNKTLEHLSQEIPKTINELHSIYGLGPRKIEIYGDDILEIINQ